MYDVYTLHCVHKYFFSMTKKIHLLKIYTGWYGQQYRKMMMSNDDLTDLNTQLQ